MHQVNLAVKPMNLSMLPNHCRDIGAIYRFIDELVKNILKSRVIQCSSLSGVISVLILLNQ